MARKNKTTAPPSDEPSSAEITFDHFVAYRPMHNFIFLPTREAWPGASVNAQLPPVPLLDAKGQPVLNSKGEEIELSASQWLDKNRPVHQLTWCPGLPEFIYDKVVAQGGWIDQHDAILSNLYRPPTLVHGDARKAKRWVDHVRLVYPNDTDHIIKYLAHRVQKPGEKINHALMLGGSQGIGKDTILEPVKQAVGPWNFEEVSPEKLLGRFTGFLKCSDPAHQRGARSRRAEPVRILRPLEDRHRCAA